MNVGVVAASSNEYRIVVVVEHGHLHRGGAYVDAMWSGAWLAAPAAACASAVIAFLSLVSAMLVPLHFDGFARFDEQQAHRDKCHFFGGLGHS